MTASRTNSRVAIVAVALVGVFLLGSSTLEAHTFTANSTVSIRFEDGKFRGRVESSRESCEKNRNVEVFKKRSRRPDLFIGHDKTNDNGRYVIPKPKGIKGRFYARVSRRETGRYEHEHRCRGVTSRIIEAP